MKKFISILLCLLMLLPLMSFGVSAADSSEGTVSNIAKLGATYASSWWNDWSQPKYLIDGEKYSTYAFWRPAKPTAEGYTGTEQYFGIKFKQYYEISSITMYAELNSSSVKYTVSALVNGEWAEVTTFANKNYVPNSGKTVSSNLNSIVTYEIEFDEPVTTKNIRITCDNYEGWYPPIVEELEVYGKLGKTPEYDIPDGAILSYNACLGAILEASSSAIGVPAAYAADTETNAKDGTASNVSQNYWKALNSTNGTNVIANFEQEFEINKVSLNFGITENALNYTVDIALLVNGVWEDVVSGIDVTTSASKTDSLIYELEDSKVASAMKVTFTETNGNIPVLNEMGASICDGKKAVFLYEYLTSERKLSIAGGNLAPYGTAYASSVFDFSSVSAIEYLNDGGINSDTSLSWIAATPEIGTYCGITLMEARSVDTIVLYFNDNLINDGTSQSHILAYDVMAKVGDEFVKVAEGTSYDTKTKKYQVSIKLDTPVETDDIRIVFTSSGQTYPYLKELEIYETGFKYSSYSALSTSRKALTATTAFAEKSYVNRSTYLSSIIPLEPISYATQTASMAQYVQTV